MVLRWYTVVIDCHDVRKQAAWWAEAFGWKTIIETDDECVNVPGWVEPDSFRDLPWERIGPGMVFVPVPEGEIWRTKNRSPQSPLTSIDGLRYSVRTDASC
jgi:hypothetical protein